MNCLGSGSIEGIIKWEGVQQGDGPVETVFYVILSNIFFLIFNQYLIRPNFLIAFFTYICYYLYV